MIKPIETKYKGYRFRSRLEARWAVFFDTFGINWHYEEEGFDINGCLYLPDFFLETADCFVEIKAKEPTTQEKNKAQLLAQADSKAKAVVILFGDLYEANSYYGIASSSLCGISAMVYPENLVHSALEDHSTARGHVLFRAFIGYLQACQLMNWVWQFNKDWPTYPISPLSFYAHEVMGDFEKALQAAREARFEHGQRG